MASVTVIEDTDVFEDVLKNRYLVIDFFAQWCGPCKKIAPLYEELASKHTNIKFCKLDVEEDEVSEVTEACGIKAMPTFCLFKNGEYVDRVEGADLDGLVKKMKEHFN